MSLLSMRFLFLALVTVLGVSSTRGWVRYLIFLAANVYFASTYLHAAGLISTAFFCLAGYAGTRLILARVKWAEYVAPVFMIIAFVYLRGYSFVHALVPTNWMVRGFVMAGLSFLFFKILHVQIDAASGTLGELRFSRYLTYCSNFTTFLLGPIQRYQDFSGQWRDTAAEPPQTFEAHLDAVNRVLRGLVKKFVLAEFLAPHALHASANIDALSIWATLRQSYVFYLYLYCDFSGYCDVMIGIGALMGVRPPENFWLPFFSRNVATYWLRVHRSLTSWLTDYVFNPFYASAIRHRILGRRPFLALSAALLVTMLVSGLWHGATSNFVIFGLLHGVYLIVFRGYESVAQAFLGRTRFLAWSQHPIVSLAAVILTFNATSLAYIPFVLDRRQTQELLAHLFSLVT